MAHQLTLIESFQTPIHIRLDGDRFILQVHFQCQNRRTPVGHGLITVHWE